jgi:hypothetical protein
MQGKDIAESWNERSVAIAESSLNSWSFFVYFVYFVFNTLLGISFYFVFNALPDPMRIRPWRTLAAIIR